MLTVFTGRLSYRGPDRLDITAKTGARSRLGGVVGNTFAPTWDLVTGYKRGRIGREEYVARYTQLMRESYRNYRSQWEELLSMERVVLVCHCPAGSFCHRLLLADLLVKCGAAYGGEISGKEQE